MSVCVTPMKRTMKPGLAAERRIKRRLRRSSGDQKKNENENNRLVNGIECNSVIADSSILPIVTLIFVFL